jgi:16S rRNA (guanine966-N2)-methyltransferase
MRIIAGTYRSRVLSAPPGMATRPTSDRLRETLFNVLAPRIGAVTFLDLYAGSGAVGIEALSRGAASVTFVERAQPALRALRANLSGLNITHGFHVETSTVAGFLRASRGALFDVVFLDPPYDATKEYEFTFEQLASSAKTLLAENALVIAEHRRKESLEDRYGMLMRTRLLEQGDAALSFYAIREQHPG